MIDWVGVVFNGMWIFGVSLAVAALSFARSTANHEESCFRKLHNEPGIWLTFGCGVVLFSLGVAGSSTAAWQRVMWGILTVLLAIQVWISIGHRHQSKRINLLNDSLSKPMTEQEASIRTEKSPRKTGWQVWFGLLISFGCLYLAFRGIDLSLLMDAVRHAHPGWILLALTTSVVTLFAKAARWQTIFAPRPKPSFYHAFSSQSIGMLFNTFAPARMGDLVRAYLMGECNSDSKVYVLGTVVVEKILDLSFLVFSVALLLTRMALPEWLIKPSEATAVILAVMIPAFFLIAWKADFFLGLLERLSFLIPQAWRRWVIRQAGHGLDSLALLRQPRLLLRPLLWSLAIWILGFSTNLFVFWAMGLGTSVWVAIFLLAVLQAGVAIPSSPGRIGVFHYLTVLGLGFFGIQKEAGLGSGVVLHLVVFVPLTFFGAWFLWREKITWSRLANAVARLQQADIKAG